MEDKKAKIEIIEFSNIDIVVTSGDGLIDNGDGSYDMPSIPIP